MRAVLSSGSNMGDARAHLQTVADEFADYLNEIVPVQKAAQ